MIRAHQLLKFKIKVVLVLLIYSSFFNLLKAQVYSNAASSKFSFTLGLTASDLMNDSIQYSPGILFNGGFVYGLRISEKLNANIELLYSGKALKTETPNIKYRCFYFDIPLYIQYNLSENCRINLGAQYSIFTNSFTSELNGNTTIGVNNKKYTPVRTTDYGFLLGAEIDILEKLTLTTRYTLSSSAFFDKIKPSFGVFSLAFRYTLYSTNKEFFKTKSD